MAITFRKAKMLLSPGDTVYRPTESGGVEPAVIESILQNSLKTDKGFLEFEDHGCTWWLTVKTAMENAYAGL